MGVFMNIHAEIKAERHYEEYGLEIIKGANKSTLNRNRELYYLDLVSISNAIEISINQLLESISYIPKAGEHLAFYKNNQHKSIRVIEISGLDELIRGLRGMGYNLELLKTIREQSNKLYEQIKHEERISYGKN